MSDDTLDDAGLSLDERKHLRTKPYNQDEDRAKNGKERTSSGFLFIKAELILVKWFAMVIWVFMSSADLSRTVSQKGTRIWFCSPTQVATMDHISLHSTSVAIYGYLRGCGERQCTASDTHGSLEASLLVAFYLSSDIA